MSNKVNMERGNEGLEVSFHFVLKDQQLPTDVLYFAFTYPYTYEDANRTISNFQFKCSERPDVYFNREVLVKSLEGRPMEIITVTGI